MKKIILASASPQRKNLMKLLGLPFSIRRSRAEEIGVISTNVADLVRDNALLKAINVAEQVKEPALVIGADTVVYAKNRLVLKPADLKEAKKNLRMLMSEPHWVYTGLAIVDTENKNVVVEHEKTKVFMTKMSGREIDRYHKAVSPLDKAGGFDIEGKGGLFIPRIEGCYFNVVGLPVARLVKMLKKFGVHALMLLVVVMASGCNGIMTNYNTATNAQETTVYTTEQEQEIGAAAAREIEKEYRVVDDPAMNERLDRILRRLVAVCDRKELVYVARIIESKTEEDKPIVNAESLPGGYIYVFKGLMDYVKNDDLLAAVVAHEIGHVTARHSVKRLQAAYADLAAVVAAIAVNRPQVAGGLSATSTALLFHFSQKDELQADALGVKYLTAAGINPRVMIGMLEKLQQYDRKQPPRARVYFRTHPYVHQRIASVDRMITGDMSFRDWVRTTGEDGKP